MGWGAQNDSNHAIPANTLQIVHTKIIACPDEYSQVWDTSTIKNDVLAKTTFPKFICIAGSAASGSPCDGDEGGMALDVLDRQFYEHCPVEVVNEVLAITFCSFHLHAEFRVLTLCKFQVTFALHICMYQTSSVASMLVGLDLGAWVRLLCMCM